MRWRCGSFDIESESPPHHLHRSATGFVSAKAQSRILAYLDPELTEEERDIVRQGRNAKSGDPQNADVLEYRHATAFETLVGYLYYTGEQDRLRELIGKSIEYIEGLLNRPLDNIASH